MTSISKISGITMPNYTFAAKAVDVKDKYLFDNSVDGRKMIYLKYGIFLAFNRSEMTCEELYLIQRQAKLPPNDVTSQSFINLAASRIDKALSRYPSAMRDKFPDRIAVMLASGGAVNDGAERPIFISAGRSSAARIINHELFHWFELGDGILTQDFMSNDGTSFDYGECKHITNVDTDWERLFGGEGPCSSVQGYADGYGKNNTAEDRATVADMLFTIGAEALRDRLIGDPTLRSKVELITGCEYDTARGAFIKVFSKNDLKERFGISDHFFYAKWSNINGRVLMDADYWNNILKENQNGGN